MLSSYALSCLLFSLLGFIVGFAGGVLGTKWRMEAYVTEGPLDRRQRLAKAISWQTAAGVLILILIAVGMTSVVQGNRRVEQVVRCQTEFNQSYTQGLTERANAAAADRDAQRRFVEASTDPLITVEGKRAAARQFLIDLDTNDGTRAANPIPQFTCQ